MNEYLKEICSAFDILIPYLKELLGETHAFAISDGEVFNRVDEKGLPSILKPGDKVPESDSNYAAFRSGDVINEIMPKEVFGWDFKSTVIPIKDDDDNVVGTISLARSLERQQKILEVANSLSEALAQISLSLNNISEGIQKVVNDSSYILEYVSQVKEENKKADEIAQFIKNIGKQTNLLGLNASIEAARAGQSGLGFAVVAEEIRKLSLSSNESIKEIEEFLQNTDTNILGIMERVEKTNNVFQEQAALIEEIAATVEELNATAQYLNELSGQF